MIKHMFERQAFALGDAPPYVVRCIDIEASGRADGHAHVTAVETHDPDGGETRWKADEAIAAIRGGDRFVIAEGEDPARVAVLEPGPCPACPSLTLVVYPPDRRPPTCD